jgi:pseudouridine-5'-phosphate glycosidase
VHRGHPFDVSADLPELAQTPVVVVCAGAKAILDLPLTLEWLETHGVPVLGFGTDTFPAFYSRSSGLPVDARCDTAGRRADYPRQVQRRPAGRRADRRAVPENTPSRRKTSRPAIQQALKMARSGEHSRQGHLTVFAQARQQLTGAKSLKANIALLENNARVAAQIAGAL